MCFPPSQIKVETTQRKNAKHTMARGSAAIDSANVNMYVTPGGSNEVYRYNITQQNGWQQLQNSPYLDSGLVVKNNNNLLAVGGRTSTGVRTNELFCLHGKEWKEYFPHMNTARSHPAVATKLHYHIVIGGYGKPGCPVSSVEVFSEENNTWILLGDLPHPLGRPSATVCGEQLYVLSGEWGSEGYSCSLKELSISSGSPPALTWTPIALPPVCRSTIATLSGMPVAVGGEVRESLTYTSTIYSLSHGQWVECGHLCKARCYTLVASLITSHMLVVVGGANSLGSLATVELCSVV